MKRYCTLFVIGTKGLFTESERKSEAQTVRILAYIATKKKDLIFGFIYLHFKGFELLTRLHSSRMRTARA